MKLPINCEVDYFRGFLDLEDAKGLYLELSELVKELNYIPQTESGISFEVNFKKIMFLDQDLIGENKFPEEQWGPTRVWTSKLKRLKVKIESFTKQQFQVCVLIFYPDGSAGVDYHSDFMAFGDTTIIPSISLGEERVFKFRNKENGNELSTLLEDGSLIIMGKHCQNRYEHSLPIDFKYKNPRINLTFRKYGFDD